MGLTDSGVSKNRTAFDFKGDPVYLKAKALWSFVNSELLNSVKRRDIDLNRQHQRCENLKRHITTSSSYSASSGRTDHTLRPVKNRH
jgi:hypothetical protein